CIPTTAFPATRHRSMRQEFFRFGWWFLAFLHIGVIWAFSSRSGTEVGLPPPYDKALHFFSYALLGFLFAKALNSPRWGFVLAALYGAIDEIHQGFVPTRLSDAWDFLADALGAYFGAGSVHVRRAQNESSQRALESKHKNDTQKNSALPKNN
ncbi:MAG: VanZ family protein, partial [Deinococcales bacterium]